MAHVISVANQKGGVGKTTTTINLAAYLSAQKKRVLIVDLDPQGNTTSGVGLDKNNLDVDLYAGLHDVTLAREIVKSTEFGFDILPTAPDLAVAEVELVNLEQREFRLRQLLTGLDYEYILIDSPPSLGLLTLNGLVAAQSVLIPVQAEYYALEGLGQLMQTIERVQQGLNPHVSLLGIVLTMHNRSTTLSKQVHEEISRHFPGLVFESVIPRNVRLAEAPSHGQPIAQYDKWSKGGRAYKQLAKEVITRVTS